MRVALFCVLNDPAAHTLCCAQRPQRPRVHGVLLCGFITIYYLAVLLRVFVSRRFVFNFINIVVKIILKHTYLLASQVFSLTKVFWKCCTYFKYRQSHFQMGLLQPVLGRLIIRHTGWCPFPYLCWPRGPTSFFIFANLAGKGRTYHCFNFYF